MPFLCDRVCHHLLLVLFDLLMVFSIRLKYNVGNDLGKIYKSNFLV